MTDQKHQFDLSPVRVEDLPPLPRLSLRVRPRGVTSARSSS